VREPWARRIILSAIGAMNFPLAREYLRLHDLIKVIKLRITSHPQQKPARQGRLAELADFGENKENGALFVRPGGSDERHGFLCLTRL
jgi:hypothetical protein